jgi:molybdopterin converting factor small subunit
MKITVKYFASIREAIGVSSEVIASQANTVMALLKARLMLKYWRVARPSEPRSIKR